MHWIRKNRRFGSSAALCALIIQLVLSFGHMHPEEILGPSAATAAQFQTADVGGTTPTDNHHDGDGHDFCAICAALNLTSNSVLPTISLLTAPIDRPHEWLADYRTAQVSFELRFHFQARAPPYSI